MDYINIVLYFFHMDYNIENKSATSPKYQINVNSPKKLIMLSALKNTSSPIRELTKLVVDVPIDASIDTPTDAPIDAPTDAPAAVAKKELTQESISKLLDGFVMVHPGLWDHIPLGAQVRYFKNGEQ